MATGPTPRSQKFISALVARTHLQQTKQYKQVGECFGVSSVSDLHDFPRLFLLEAILSSGDRVAVSSFEGAHGIVWTFLERKELIWQLLTFRLSFAEKPRTNQPKLYAKIKIHRGEGESRWCNSQKQFIQAKLAIWGFQTSP